MVPESIDPLKSAIRPLGLNCPSIAISKYHVKNRLFCNCGPSHRHWKPLQGPPKFQIDPLLLVRQFNSNLLLFLVAASPNRVYPFSCPYARAQGAPPTCELYQQRTSRQCAEPTDPLERVVPQSCGARQHPSADSPRLVAKQMLDQEMIEIRARAATSFAFARNRPT